MTKLIKKAWDSINYENAPCFIAIIFFFLGEYYDTFLFYPLAVISLLSFYSTKAICQAVREGCEND